MYSFTSAVCGFHYYRKFWKPIENETLNCLYEDNNPYDKFEIKNFDKLWRNCRPFTQRNFKRYKGFFLTARHPYK